MHHERLGTIVQTHPRDYEPYGEVERNGGDCSGGCIYFYPLAAKDGEELGQDWGACANPRSHRVGLLTFEHQGCLLAVYGIEDKGQP